MEKKIVPTAAPVPDPDIVQFVIVLLPASPINCIVEAEDDVLVLLIVRDAPPVFNPSIVAKNGINLGTSISDSMWLTRSGTGTVTFASGMTLHTENHPSGAGAFDAGGGPNTGTGYDGASGAWPQRVAVWGNSVEASLQNLITVVNNINTTLQDTGIFT